MSESTRYEVLMAASEKALAVIVEHRIAEGWQTVGGLAVRVDPGGDVWFYQAMVKLPPRLADPADLEEPGYAVRPSPPHEAPVTYTSPAGVMRWYTDRGWVTTAPSSS